MTHPTAVINVVALSRSLIGDATPHLKRFIDGGRVRLLEPVLPAVTCSVQASMLTGRTPRDHGIVGNGWYDRDYCETRFWKQSNRLVTAEKVWETARQRDPSVTCANLFWWFNMYSTADYSVTPRPMYPADGRKIPDVYTEPPPLRFELQRKFGRFPLFNFWGPASSIRSSRWIVDAALHTHARYSPTLTLIYLPHLDYSLQKFGPGSPEVQAATGQIDAEFGRLVDYFDRHGVRVMVVSEYGIEPVREAILLNQVLRSAGALRVREERGTEMVDPGASEAFAVADHQVAHVYTRDPDDAQRFAGLCRGVPGVERVLERREQAELGIDHPRGGDVIVVAARGKWFSYKYWLDDARAPDFARTVDIHRKPGYDPLDLFIDPQLTLPKLRIAWKLFKRKLGFRTLLDVIPLDTSLVRGSHGRLDVPDDLRPLLITRRDDDRPDTLPCTAVRDVILDHLFEEDPAPAPAQPEPAHDDDTPDQQHTAPDEPRP